MKVTEFKIHIFLAWKVMQSLPYKFVKVILLATSSTAS